MTSTQSLQESMYVGGFDYRVGSPHLKHWHLFERLNGLLRGEMRRVSDAGLTPTMLDVGSGEGSFAEPSLAYGFSVTATDMSRASIERLRERFHSNPNFSAVFDADGSLDRVADRQFSLVLCSSVLHHIPDYVGFLVQRALPRVVPGGSLISIQDPLWYPRMARTDLLLTKASYFSWRLTQGHLLDGLRTRVRRLRRVFDENNPADMVEYHVVRSGCDDHEIERQLAPHFENVSIIPYWSSQGTLSQQLGHRFKRENTFAVVACSRLRATSGNTTRL